MILPIDQNWLSLLSCVSYFHTSNHQPIHLGAFTVEVHFHVERCSGLHIKLIIDQGPVLADTDIEHRNWCFSSDFACDFNVRAWQKKSISIRNKNMLNLLFLEVNRKVRLSLDNWYFRHLWIIRWCVGWCEPHVTLHQECLLRSFIFILHHNTMIVNCPTLDHFFQRFAAGISRDLPYFCWGLLWACTGIYHWVSGWTSHGCQPPLVYKQDLQNFAGKAIKAPRIGAKIQLLLDH